MLREWNVGAQDPQTLTKRGKSCQSKLSNLASYTASYFSFQRPSYSFLSAKDAKHGPELLLLLHRVYTPYHHAQ